MMPKMTIHQRWKSDPRREKLGELLGNPREVEHVIYNTWCLAQEYWERGELIPGEVFMTMYGALAVLQARLACLYGGNTLDSPPVRTPEVHIEYRPNELKQGDSPNTCSNTFRTHLNIIEQAYVYVRGTKEFLSWGIPFRQKRVEAGRKSAEKRRLLYGTAQPKVGGKVDSPNTCSNTLPTHSNTLELTSTSTNTSTNTSKKKKKNTNVGIRVDYPQEFDDLWRSYGQVGKEEEGKFEGRGDKKEAWEVFQSLDLLPDEIPTLKVAIVNYVRANEWKYRSHFCRFLKMDWREFAKAPIASRYGDTNSEEQHHLALEETKARIRQRYQQQEGIEHETE